MIKTKHLPKIVSITISAAALMLAACSPSGSEQKNTRAEVTDNPLASVFAESVTLKTDVANAKYSGDLNGDGVTDSLLLVAQSKAVLPAGVTLLEPWPHYDETPVSKDIAKGSQMRLVVVHGKTQQGFLIRDTNSISVLDAPAAQETHVLNKKEIPRLGEPELEKLANGDIIVVPTEAGIDNYLYWDGAKYALFQVFDMP